jgi:hypothetical protein
MDQKPIVLYLRMKGMGLNAIHDDLVRTLGKDAVAYSMVIKYIHSVQFSKPKRTTPPETPDVERSPVDEAIFTALVEFQFPFLFSSVCEFSRRICLPRSTVHLHRHFTQSFCFTVRHLRWGAQIQSTIFHYYTNDILVEISDWRRQTGGTRPNRHLIPYSPDLAPSNFFLLTKSKER